MEDVVVVPDETVAATFAITENDYTGKPFGYLEWRAAVRHAGTTTRVIGTFATEEYARNACKDAAADLNGTCEEIVTHLELKGAGAGSDAGAGDEYESGSMRWFEEPLTPDGNDRLMARAWTQPYVGGPRGAAHVEDDFRRALAARLAFLESSMASPAESAGKAAAAAKPAAKAKSVAKKTRK